MRFLAVDTGGTFTDFVLFDGESGRIETFKVLSTPTDPASAVETGLKRVSDEHGVPIETIERFIFGTTVATNAVLERKGARVALLTTRGMRDVLEIQRQWRQRLFDLYLQKPEPLARRRNRIDVNERLNASGEVVVELAPDEVERVADLVASLDIDAVAVSTLFSFLNPSHEGRLVEAVRRRKPDLPVTASHEVCPEFREYERTATTVMNAYTMPVVMRLVDRLEEVLGDLGFKGAFGIIQSNGGLMSLAKARSHPVNTLLSGPAGGVIGATEVSLGSGEANLLGFDVGGTSTDIALIEDGTIRLTPDGGIGGYPVKVPQVGVHTIGAGGGSIARPVLGTLKVGPESAGAQPGPVCYGRGGEAPTGTDAAVALGYIDPAFFAGGEMALNSGAAGAAILEQVATPLGLTQDEGALAILRVQAANIVTGIRKVSVEIGKDPRDFVLVPFGGAGGLYAGLVAEEAGMSRILLPRYPSVLSALGMLMTDVRHELVRSRVQGVDTMTAKEISELFDDLAAEACEVAAREGAAADAVTVLRSLDMRYVGQAYEINVPLSEEIDAAADPLTALRSAFDAEHERLYGQCSPSEPVEIVNHRVGAIGSVRKARLSTLAPRDSGTATPRNHRRALFNLEDGWQDCPVFNRERLHPGDRVIGPAFVEDNGSSFVLFPWHRLHVDALGNVLVDLPSASMADRQREGEVA